MMKKILWVDCCLRPEDQSRTYQLTKTFLDSYQRFHPQDQVTHLRLAEEPLSIYNGERVEQRIALISQKKWDHPLFTYAAQLLDVDKMIISAPFWDLSFPALLKIYIENIFVTGLTFHYTAEGPAGLLKAERLLYIMTAGGFAGEDNQGAAYLKQAGQMLGIPQFDQLSAEGLDIAELDAGGILAQAMSRAKALAQIW